MAALTGREPTGITVTKAVDVYKRQMLRSMSARLGLYGPRIKSFALRNWRLRGAKPL